MVAVLERSPGRILKTRCAVVYVPVTVVICAGFGYWVTGKEILPTSIDSRLSFTINALSKGNYRTAANYASETENALGAWLAENTAPDVVVLHDPSLQMIRPLAERSSVVQRKLVGFSTDAIHAWLERMDATTDFCAISYDTLLSVARRYKADLIAVSMECTGAHGIERSFRIGDMWVVYEVRL